MDAFNDILNIIEFSNYDPNSFVDFYAKVYVYMRPSITMDEVYHTLGSSLKYPSIYIIA